MEDFIHLHVHTQYSILDGQSKIPHLVDKAIKDGMKGMAVTDHGVMFGIKELTDYCGKVNKGRKKKVWNLLSLLLVVRCMWPIEEKRIVIKTGVI